LFKFKSYEEQKAYGVKLSTFTKEQPPFTIESIKALSRELIPVGMTYFIRQFENGEDDYTKERADIGKEMKLI